MPLYKRLIVDATNLSAENIKDGVTILGVTGTLEEAAPLTGDAVVGDVLTGKLFYKDDANTQLTGTMPNNGAESTDISAVATEVTISAGYHNGSGVVKIAAADQAKLITGNIKAGVTVLGVSGATNVVDTSSGDAIAGEILTGKKAWVDGTEITGTMADKEGDNVATSSSVDGTTLKLVAPTGFYDGTDTVTITDADFAAANIKDTVNIFGIVGTYAAGGSTLTGDAAVGEVLDGKFFYSNDPDTKLEGTMPNNSSNNVEVTDVDGTLIPAGYYNGTGSAVLSATEAAKVVDTNIRSGVTLLGVTGNANVVNTSSGDAVAGEILTGKKAWVDGSEVTGTMPDNEGDNVASSSSVSGTTLKLVAPTGFYDGTDTVTITDADFVAANIADGVDIFGITGTMTGSSVLTGDAAVANVLSGKTFYADDPASKLTGTMPNNAGDTAATSTHAGASGEIHAVVPEGYYDGTDDAVVLTDADFVSTNIKAGVNIFGVDGNVNVVDTSSGDATAAQILYGKKAWVDGSEITGTYLDVTTKAHLPLDGANGSTTITDLTGKSWTAAGTAKISTAQSHAGGASLLLDGDSDWIYTADSDDFNLGGNDFTIEMWLRFTTLTNGAPYVICSQYASGMSYLFWYIFDSTAGQRKMYLEHQVAGGNRSVNTSAAFTLSADTWYHFAISKQNAVLRMFKDGTKVGNDIAYNYTIDDFAANLVVGAGANGGAYWVPGYIDNFIFTKGYAKYWADFTPT